MESQFEIRIYGRVQGVGFRAAAKRQARYLRLNGWIENKTDGSVRAVFKGDPLHCSQFINWCRIGTGYSWVERMDIREMEPESLEPFAIRY
jgi:acylphosphatase